MLHFVFTHEGKKKNKVPQLTGYSCEIISKVFESLSETHAGLDQLVHKLIVRKRISRCVIVIRVN